MSEVNEQRAVKVAALTRAVSKCFDQATVSFPDRMSVLCSLLLSEAANRSEPERAYMGVNLTSLCDAIDAMGAESDPKQAADLAVAEVRAGVAQARVIQADAQADHGAPPLVRPSQEQQQTIMRLTDSLNASLKDLPVSTVMSALVNIVLAGFMGVDVGLRRAILADVQLLLQVLQSIGQEHDPDEIQRRVMAVMGHDNVFGHGRPAGATTH